MFFAITLIVLGIIGCYVLAYAGTSAPTAMSMPLFIGALAITLTGLLSGAIVLSLWVGDQLQAWWDQHELQKELAMDCTREHRMQAVECYVFTPDGGLWEIYAACEHGVSETTPVWMPKYPQLMDTENATVQVASAERQA